MRQALTQLFRSVGAVARMSGSPSDLSIPYPLARASDTDAPIHDSRTSAEREFFLGNVMIW